MRFGIWDLKVDLLSAPGVVGADSKVIIGKRNLNFQVVANIFYGYVGRAIGMPELYLQAGAGIAQTEHGWDHWVENLKAYPFGFGDQEFDAWAIRFGFYLFDLYGLDLSLLTRESFAATLDEYIRNNPVPILQE